MLDVHNATDVRKEWGGFIDSVVRQKPQIVKRNRDFILALSLEHMATILSQYKLTMEYEQEPDGSYSGALREIDLTGNAKDLPSLKRELAQELLEYAREYIENFPLYYHSPNRRDHFPYILRVLIQEDLDGVVQLIEHA